MATRPCRLTVQLRQATDRSSGFPARAHPAGPSNVARAFQPEPPLHRSPTNSPRRITIPRGLFAARRLLPSATSPQTGRFGHVCLLMSVLIPLPMPSIAGPAVGRTVLGLESPSYVNTDIRGPSAIRLHPWPRSAVCRTKVSLNSEACWRFMVTLRQITAN